MSRKTCYTNNTLRNCDKKADNTITNGWGNNRVTKHYCDEHFREQKDWSGHDDIEFQFESPDLFNM